MEERKFGYHDLVCALAVLRRQRDIKNQTARWVNIGAGYNYNRSSLRSQP